MILLEKAFNASWRTNYWAFSNLPFSGKMMEFIVASYLQVFLEVTDYLHHYHSHSWPIIEATLCRQNTLGDGQRQCHSINSLNFQYHSPVVSEPVTLQILDASSHQPQPIWPMLNDYGTCRAAKSGRLKVPAIDHHSLLDSLSGMGLENMVIQWLLTENLTQVMVLQN